METLKQYKHLQLDWILQEHNMCGESEGIPNEEGIKIDALTAFNYVKIKKQKLIQIKYIYLVVQLQFILHLKSKNYKEIIIKIAGLITENTFSSISDMVGKVFPFLDFDFIKKFMLKIHWKSIDKIGYITSDMLFLACSKDEIVPNEQMLNLYENAKNAKSKDLYVIERW
eukprot:500375_1